MAPAALGKPGAQGLLWGRVSHSPTLGVPLGTDVRIISASGALPQAGV